MFVLDTDTCIEILRHNRAVVERRAEVADVVGTTWMTAAELHYGAARSKRPTANRRTVGEFLGMETLRGQRHLYKVVGVDIVDSRKGSLVLDTDTAMLTLVTCYPFDALEAGGPLRYVVTARMMF